MPGTSTQCFAAGTPCPAVAGPTVPGATGVPLPAVPAAATTGVVMPTIPGTVGTPGTATGGPVPAAPSTSPAVATPTAPSTATLGTSTATVSPSTATVVPGRPAAVGSDGIGLVPIALGALGLLVLVALVAAALAGRRGRRPESRRAPSRQGHLGAPAIWQPSSGGDSGDGTERAAFAPTDAEVADLIHAFDLAGTEAERAVVERQLAAIGVVRLPVSPGDPVDPTRHQVVGIAPHGSAGAAGTVSEVVRPGWADARQVIRVSDVRAHAATGVHP